MGAVFLIPGVIGLVVPMMPGFVFLIVSTYFFSRSSERFHNWILTNKWFGNYISSIYNGTKLPMRAKIISGLFFAVSLAVAVGIFIVK